MAKAGKRRQASTEDDASDSSGFDERFPNLAAQRDWDRAEHIRAAEEMGATHRQASKHASEEVGDH
ncbi:MAG: hypothetical protein QOJ26_1642 [Thermoplasmata archaeon]|jgi:hypothetical protein|nr:hypothetical protein [Thermoplasmata archaeon]